MNFIFIGLEEHLVDGIAPRVGKRLIEEGKLKTRNCFFCNGKNIESTQKALEKRKSKVKIAVDITNIKDLSNDMFNRIRYSNMGLCPANNIREQTIRLGNKGIVVNAYNIYAEEKGDWLSNLVADKRSELIEKRVKVLEELLYHACIASIELYKRKEVIECITNPMEEKTSQKS